MRCTNRSLRISRPLDTRYLRPLTRSRQAYPTKKPWPIIAKFLSSIPPGHIGLDSGTGNGKYLSLPGPSSPMIGLDRSRNLLRIARHAGSQSTVDYSSVLTTINEVVQADVLNKCWRVGVFVRFPAFFGSPGTHRVEIGLCDFHCHNTPLGDRRAS